MNRPLDSVRVSTWQCLSPRDSVSLHVSFYSHFDENNAYFYINRGLNNAIDDT